MKTKAERTQTIEMLQNAFTGASGIYLTDITRITVAQMTQLRTDMRKKGLRYIVVKNSLARKASDRCGKATMTPFFKGPIGVVLAEQEATLPAKVLRDFRKTNKDLLKVKAALVEGALVKAEQVERLADIPSRTVLLGQLLSVMQAPVANLAGALNGILNGLTGTLEAVRQQKEKMEPAK